MEPKEYQIKTLNRVKQYLDLLYQWRQKALANPDLEVDFPAKAWSKMEDLYDGYKSRRDGLDRPPSLLLPENSHRRR